MTAMIGDCYHACDLLMLKPDSGGLAVIRWWHSGDTLVVVIRWWHPAHTNNSALSPPITKAKERYILDVILVIWNLSLIIS